MIAENDLALGEVVDVISHSQIWAQSLILVIEDDSQDGLDHVDAHRIPAFAISPYSRRNSVTHTRYDFLSVIRTLERVVGMKPLNLFDAVAVPMYDAFDADPSDNDEPYDRDRPRCEPPRAKHRQRPQCRALEATAAGLHRPHPAAVCWTRSSGITSTAPTPSPRRPGRTPPASTRHAGSVRGLPSEPS